METILKPRGTVMVLAACIILGGGTSCRTGEGSESPTPEDSPAVTPTPMVTPTATPTVDSSAPGNVNVSFRMDDDWVDELKSKTGEDPVGYFYGSVFWTSDVSDDGPSDGAESIADLTVYVDMRPAGEQTEVLHRLEGLESGAVTILGFLDSDGNAVPEDPITDPYDPVTKPGYNQFQVVAGKDSEAVVFFNFLFPTKP